jgi:hypothetical protein
MLAAAAVIEAYCWLLLSTPHIPSAAQWLQLVTAAAATATVFTPLNSYAQLTVAVHWSACGRVAGLSHDC